MIDSTSPPARSDTTAALLRWWRGSPDRRGNATQRACRFLVLFTLAMGVSHIAPTWWLGMPLLLIVMAADVYSEGVSL